MTTVDLAFGSNAALPSNAVDLAFGVTGGGAPPVGVTVSLPLTIALAVQAEYRLPAVLAVSTRAPWRAAARGPGVAAGAPWATATGRATAPTRLPWATATGRATAPTRLPWSSGVKRGTEAVLPWAQGTPRGATRRAPWGQGTPSTASRRLPWADPQRATRSVRVPWDQGTPLFAPLAPWVPPADPNAPPTRVRLNLHFCRPAPVGGLTLSFGTDPCADFAPAAQFILPARSYVLTHSLSVLRLPDLTPLDVFAASITTDDSAFGWQLSATGPTSLMSLLAPDGAGVPKTIRLTVDGLVWEFVVEGLRQTRTFGDTTATITGRSKTVLLADPYYPETQRLNSSPITANQIVDEALGFSGATAYWGVTDWLVPAGAWSFTGTPLSVARRVADSIGAVLRSHRSLPQLRVEPRYPVLPWNWAAATPAVSIAPDAILSEGFERADRPPYNGVFVSGTNQGVFAHVKRTGTAGERLMPMATDALVTHLDAARQRGESMLGGAGLGATMTLQTPVMTGPGQPGVIDPGTLVEVAYGSPWRGLVRAVSVAIDLPTVTQTLTIERRL